MFFEDDEEVNCTHSCHSCAGCGHDHDVEIPEDFEPVITLTAEDGKEIKFEILDVVALEETAKEYLIVAPAEDMDKDDIEVTILEINQDGDEEVYDTVVDEKVAEKVFNVFQKQQEDEE